MRGFLTPDGEIALNEAMVSIEDVSGFRALGVSPYPQDSFSVTGDLCAADIVSEVAHSLSVGQELVEVMPGRYELPLRLLIEGLRQLFGMSSDLDAIVRLSITKSGAEYPLKLLVSRFELNFATGKLAGTYQN